MALIEGTEFRDDYGSIHPDDSKQWLEMFKIIEKRVNYNLCAKLMYIRNTGAVLVRSTEYGYRIQPVYGMYGWENKAEYDRERKYLEDHREHILDVLKELRRLYP